MKLDRDDIIGFHIAHLWQSRWIEYDGIFSAQGFVELENEIIFELQHMDAPDGTPIPAVTRESLGSDCVEVSPQLSGDIIAEVLYSFRWPSLVVLTESNRLVYMSDHDRPFDVGLTVRAVDQFSHDNDLVNYWGGRHVRLP